MYLAWKNTITTKQINHPLIRTEIAESWKRCLRAKVDPYGGVGNYILKGEELEKVLYINKELIEVARPFLLNLYKFLKNSGFIVMLTNSEGVILEFFGDNYMEEEAAQIHFMKGARWKEEDVGSNTIGVIINTKKPFQMTGPEHFCIKSHDWTCSAAPIFNSNGEMMGIFNVSGPIKEAHRHTLGMVVAAVEAIQHLLTISHKNHELNRISKRMNSIFQSMSDAVIILDSYGYIEQINLASEKIFGKPSYVIGKTFNELIIEDREDIEKNNNYLDEYAGVSKLLKTRRGNVECIISSKPIKNENHIEGTIIVVHPIDKVNSIIKKFNNSQARFFFQDIITNNRRMEKIIDLAINVSKSDGTVLIQGESGTGKEVFAQSIHNNSSRRKGPFIAVNCGAIPRELLGSELFGYSEGSFTGAKRGGMQGKFELASGGTIFLDEIGDMPLEQQVSLLRVLQEKKIVRIGDSKEISIDVHVICATNKKLSIEIEKGNFRQDLFYRLNVINIRIPALRERKEDIEILFNYFVKKMSEKNNRDLVNIDKEIYKYLNSYYWPGNVRELQNVVERMITLNNSDKLTVTDLPAEIYSNDMQNSVDYSHDFSRISYENVRERSRKIRIEEEHNKIYQLLLDNHGNISKVSKILGISRTTLYRKINKYNINI